MESLISKSDIYRYFSGKSTPEEKGKIKIWLQKEGSQELFYQWLEEWENQHLSYLPNVQKGVKEFTIKRNLQNLKTSLFSSKSIGIAASVTLLFLTTFLLKDKIIYKEYTTGYSEIRKFNLEDGSTVVLDPNSTLTVPRFGFKNRVVTLSGEAQFSVIHTQNHSKFIVKTKDNTDITVLGTVFSVYSRHKGTKIFLNEGKVRLNYKHGRITKTTIMAPGELFTLSANKVTPTPTITNKPEAVSTWKENRYVFNNTSLKEFTKILLEDYGLKVEIEDEQLAQRTIEGTFTAEGSEDLLQMVAEIFNLTVINQGKSIKLTDNQPQI